MALVLPWRVGTRESVSADFDHALTQEILRTELVRIKALLRKEVEAKLKVTGEEIKAEIAKVKEANQGISDADAALRAVKSVSGSRLQKIQEDLIAAAKKETAAAVDPAGVARSRPR